MGKTTLPEDTLTAQDLSPVFVGQSGLPREADALAYDPVQRLLAVRMCACTASGEASGQIADYTQGCVDTWQLIGLAQAWSGPTHLHLALYLVSLVSLVSEQHPQPLCLELRGLQVASTDGRVLLFGRDGVEQTLPSPTSAATAGLFFLPAKDSLLRITTVRTGLMFLFGGHHS